MILLVLAAAASACAVHIWQQQTIINKLIAMSDTLDQLNATEDAEKTVLDTILAGVDSLKAVLAVVQQQLADALAQEPAAGFADLLTKAKANLTEAQTIAARFAPAPPAETPRAPVEEAPAPESPAPVDPPTEIAPPAE